MKNPRRHAMFRYATAVVVILAVGQARLAAQDLLAPPPPGAEEQPEVLLRGPLHEAFAEVVNLDPQAGIVVAKSPPDPIAEMPPEVKPADNAIWISGYWAWDDDRNDFIWISGVWRVPPPGRRWVPGYWTPEGRGSRWIAGFWAKAEADAVELLPNPPEALEHGPNGPAPGDDFFWVSGCWVHNGVGFVWRPGLWTQGYTDWIWVPSHYVWTPRGCIYVPGYWDHRIVNRGMCFAPVHFRNPARWRTVQVFWPQVAIDLPWLHLHLFVRPQYSHYYFGDWYVGYDRLGIYSGYSYYTLRGYDPVWTYFEWVSRRQGIDYAQRAHGWQVYYQQHADMRPPRDLIDQHRFVVRNAASPYLSQTVLAVEIRDVIARRDVRVDLLTERQRRDIGQRSLVSLDLVDARREVETRVDRGGRGPSPRSDQAVRDRVRLPVTPEVQELRDRVVATRIDRPEAMPPRDMDRPRDTTRPRETGPPRGMDRPRDTIPPRDTVQPRETAPLRETPPASETPRARTRAAIARTVPESSGSPIRQNVPEPTTAAQRASAAAAEAAARRAEIVADAEARRATAEAAAEAQRETVRARAEAISRQRAAQPLASPSRAVRPAEEIVTQPFAPRTTAPITSPITAPIAAPTTAPIERRSTIRSEPAGGLQRGGAAIERPERLTAPAERSRISAPSTGSIVPTPRAAAPAVGTMRSSAAARSPALPRVTQPAPPSGPNAAAPARARATGAMAPRPESQGGPGQPRGNRP